MKKVLLVLSVALIGLTSCQKEEDAPAPVAPTPVVVTPVATVRTTSIVEYFSNPPNSTVSVSFVATNINTNRTADIGCGPNNNSNIDLEVGKTYSINVNVNFVQSFHGDIVIEADNSVTKSNVTVGQSVSFTYSSNCNNQGVAKLGIAP